MRFLLFVPDCAPGDLEAKAKVGGFAHLLTGSDRVNSNGPESKRGLMIGWPDPKSPHLNYAEQDQTWVPSIAKTDDGDPHYYVGFWNDKPPTESELRRHYTQAGALVNLGGDRWKLPTPDTVDAEAVYNDDGSMRWEVIREFSWMCDEADKLRETYLEESGIRAAVFTVEPSAQVEWLLKLLQVNYLITAEVAAHLHLWIGREHLLDVFLATLGLHRTGDEEGDDNG